MNRIDWDTYFCEIAKLTAKRSGCLRRGVGAVIVKDNRVIATGYNAQPVGVPECCSKGYCMRQHHKGGIGLEECTVVHAEINAITQCALLGISCNGATMYVTTKCCIWCLKAAINAGIKKIVYIEDYNAPLSDELAKITDIEMVKYEGDN